LNAVTTAPAGTDELLGLLGAGIERARNLAADLRLLPALQRGLGHTGILREGAPFDVRGFVAAAAADGAIAPGWEARSTLSTVSDSIIVLVGPPGERPAALIKVAYAAGAKGADHDRVVLETLHADTRLGFLHPLLPVVHASGEAAGRRYLVEAPLPGVMVAQLVGDPSTRARVLPAAVAAIGSLHRATQGEPAIAADQALARLIDAPAGLLRRMAVGVRPRCWSALDRLTETVRESLAGKALARSWVHGDFVPSNILAAPDGGEVTGIVDWELAVPDGLPQLDAVNLLLSTRVLMRRRELGPVVRELLSDPRLDDCESDILEVGRRDISGDPIDLQSLVLLSWLHHVSSTLMKSPRYRRSRLWSLMNVVSVLHRFVA
jgi:hypothetical protein